MYYVFKKQYICIYSIYAYTSAYFLTPAISLKIQLYDVCKRLPRDHKSNATKSDRNTQSHQITSTNFILLMAQKSG